MPNDTASPATLTVAILMEPGTPILATTFARHITATVKVLNATDRALHGRITTAYYLTGFDLAEDGVAYRLTALPKGVAARITNVDANAPSLLHPQRVDGTEVPNA